MSASLERPRVIVVGVVLDGDDRIEVDESLRELERLVDTVGAQVSARLVQTRHRIDAATFIGSGKAEALRELAEGNEAAWVAIDHDLSPAQAKNLERIIGRPVVDRCGVILNIFSRNARTAVAKMQVELANLDYLLPRLKHQWTHLSRQLGGIGVRGGAGESQIELDRRAIRKRMSVLKEKLARVSVQREVQRQDRKDVFKVALVGYTNSGKSTLLNRLCDTGVLVEDRLFSTLDSKVASISPSLKPSVLVSDTVGFIRRLPHGLVESFKSTLEEASYADLLLHVVDLSDPRFEAHLEVGKGVMDDLGLQRRPRLLVFNKTDRVGNTKLARVVTAVHRDSLAVSAATGEGMDDLRGRILSFFDARLHERTLEFDYGDSSLVARLYETSRVRGVEYLDGRVRVTVRATAAELARLERLRTRGGA